MTVATVTELTNPHFHIFTAVPQASACVCRLCRKQNLPNYPQCASCLDTVRQVTHPVETVVPISLYLAYEQLHTMLRGYKDPEVMQLTEAQGRLWELVVAATVARFMLAHEGSIADHTSLETEVLTTIPSSRGRSGSAPLHRALMRSPDVAKRLEELLEPGPVSVEKRKASDKGFTVQGNVDGRTVLLLDDTYTTGASVQSAGSALTSAGASVVAAVVVGRAT